MRVGSKGSRDGFNSGKSNVKRSKEAGAQLKRNTKRSTQFGKRTLSLVLSGATIAATLGAALFIMRSNNDTIQVARFATDVKSGTIITQDLFEPVEMTQEDFNRIGTVQYVNSAGETVTDNRLVPWSKIGNFTGDNNKFSQSFYKDGTLVHADMFTGERLVRSEWTKGVPEGYEYYTLDLSEIDDVYNPIFFPGAHIRIRMSHELKYDPSDPASIRAIEEVRTAIANKERASLTGSYIKGESEILDALYAGQISSAGESTGGYGQSAYQNVERTITISEVIWDDIVIIDMLNSAGESIFDLYLDLLDMPVSKRIAYLQTKLEDEGEDLSGRVKPSSIVFVVTREEASKLLEFEKLDADLKVTLIESDDNDYNLYKQFTEVGDQVSAMIESFSQLTSFNEG